MFTVETYNLTRKFTFKFTVNYAIEQSFLSLFDIEHPNAQFRLIEHCFLS